MTKRIREEIDTEALEPARVKIPQPQRVSVSRAGMISTAHFSATRIGRDVLESGGNAVDAAVAAAFALGVCEPQASGLGGQTMLLIHLEGENRTLAIDGSSRAPNRALAESLKSRSDRVHGYQATTVPSTPAVLDYVLKRFGSCSLSEMIAPAADLAESGYPITALQHRLQTRERKNFALGNAGNVFLRAPGKPYSVGHIFKQPDLAATLRRLAEMGIEDFYRGEIADKIHDDMQANGGFLNRDDLARIPAPIEREPLKGSLGDLIILTMPPPGAGRTLLEMANILRKFPRRDHNPDTPEGALLLAEVIRRAQLDRRDRPFDPNFYPQVQDRRMVSSKYAGLVAEQIRLRIKTGGETTHVSVMDRWDNVVSLTQSIERVYGAKVVTPGLGFLYNNYLSAFDLKDMSHPYHLRPNAAPWASVAPTLVFRRQKPWLAIGSPGSERIASTILQVLIRMKLQSPFDAVAAPRLHCSYSGKVSLEAASMRDDIPPLLESRGFDIDIREPMSFYLGCVQMVLREKDYFIGVADPRRDGAAGGPRM